MNEKFRDMVDRWKEDHPFDGILATLKVTDWASDKTRPDRLKLLLDTVRTGKAAGEDDVLISLAYLPEDQRAEVFVSFLDWWMGREATAKAAKREETIREELTAVHEVQLSKIQQEIEKLQNQLSRIRNRRSTMNTQFLLLLAFAIIFTAFIVVRGWAGKPGVSIEYNVGEIIAGILGGGGAAVAGTVYAISKLREMSNREER